MTGDSARPSRVRFRSVILAEMIKLVTLPSLVATAALTVLAAPAVGGGARYLQVGFLTAGALAAGSERAGSQIVATYLAVPRRHLAIGAKSVAFALLAGPVAATSVVVGVVRQPSEPQWAPGAAFELVLLGMLALGVTVVLRGSVPGLVSCGIGILVVSPLVELVWTGARWGPVGAGARLHAVGSGPGRDALVGGAVLVAWVALSVLAAVGSEERRAVSG